MKIEFYSQVNQDTDMIEVLFVDFNEKATTKISAIKLESIPSTEHSQIEKLLGFVNSCIRTADNKGKVSN